MNLPVGKKVYFASDFHLGLPDYQRSIEREKLICQWLDQIKLDAYKIYLVGDLFDVWFEYKNVIPKGYTRFLGKLAELSDLGISIEIFTGNHDLWMKDYFQEELNIAVHTQPIEIVWNEKSFFIGHGDGLGPGDHGYKFLKCVISHRLSQWLYRRLHPDTGIALATYFSRKGPKHVQSDHLFLGADKEWLIQYSIATLRKKHIDYFIFGHRHLALTYPLSETSTYINLGDWLAFQTYAVFDGHKTTLLQYPSHQPYSNTFQ